MVKSLSCLCINKNFFLIFLYNFLNYNIIIQCDLYIKNEKVNLLDLITDKTILIFRFVYNTFTSLD